LIHESPGRQAKKFVPLTARGRRGGSSAAGLELREQRGGEIDFHFSRHVGFAEEIEQAAQTEGASYR
jgi:hypothetical protein